MILEFKISITALLSFNIIFSLYAIFTDFIDWIKNKEYRKKVNLKLKDVICFANILLLFIWLILPLISIIVLWVWGQELKIIEYPDGNCLDEFILDNVDFETITEYLLLEQKTDKARQELLNKK